MGEKLSTRRESNKEIYENSEKYQAIKTLSDLGLLVRMDDLEIYHGRSGNGEDWAIKPDFDNSGNKTGNRNINKIPTLYTSNRSVAKEFADRRSMWSSSSTPEVHRILSNDKDACIINDRFEFGSLNSEEQEKFKSAIHETLPGLLEGAPIDFIYRNDLRKIKPNDFRPSDELGLIYSDDLEKNTKNLHIAPDLSHAISSAKNTRIIIEFHPGLIDKLIHSYTKNKSEIKISFHNKEHTVPFNREYLLSWLREIHAVGFTQYINSATLGGKQIVSYTLFDLEKVNTASKIQEEKRFRNKRYGGIALEVEKHRSAGVLAKELTNNLYIEPDEIIKLAKQTPGYKKVFESDAGNWEKYSLEEHTETVLRFFDHNYADILPASTLPIMRLALLVHDIGKPEAVKRHNKANQKQYNKQFAEDFMKKNNIDPANRALVLAMIGTGLDFTTRWLVKKEKNLTVPFYDFCEETLQKYTGEKNIDPETVTGFRDMLRILQTCDSAAYTTMAVTRSAQNGNGIIYRNSGSFNESFDPFHGLTGHRAEFKKAKYGKTNS